MAMTNRVHILRWIVLIQGVLIGVIFIDFLVGSFEIMIISNPEFGSQRDIRNFVLDNQGVSVIPLILRLFSFMVTAIAIGTIYSTDAARSQKLVVLIPVVGVVGFYYFPFIARDSYSYSYYDDTIWELVIIQLIATSFVAAGLQLTLALEIPGGNKRLLIASGVPVGLVLATPLLGGPGAVWFLISLATAAVSTILVNSVLLFRRTREKAIDDPASNPFTDDDSRVKIFSSSGVVEPTMRDG